MLSSFLLWLSIGGLYDIPLLSYAMSSGNDYIHSEPIQGQYKGVSHFGNLPVGRYVNVESDIQLDIMDNNTCKLSSTDKGYEFSFKTRILLANKSLRCYKGVSSGIKVTPMYIRQLFKVRHSLPFEASIIEVCYSRLGRVWMRRGGREPDDPEATIELTKVPEETVLHSKLPRLELLVPSVFHETTPLNSERSSDGSKGSANRALHAAEIAQPYTATSRSELTASLDGLIGSSRKKYGPNLVKSVPQGVPQNSNLFKASRTLQGLVRQKSLDDLREKNKMVTVNKRELERVEKPNVDWADSSDDMLTRAMLDAGIDAENVLRYEEPPAKVRRLSGDPSFPIKVTTDSAAGTPQPPNVPSQSYVTFDTEHASADPASVNKSDYAMPSNSGIGEEKAKDIKAGRKTNEKTEADSSSDEMELPELDTTELNDFFAGQEKIGASDGSHNQNKKASESSSHSSAESPQLEPYTFDTVLQGWEY